MNILLFVYGESIDEIVLTSSASHPILTPWMIINFHLSLLRPENNGVRGERVMIPAPKKGPTAEPIPTPSE
jgi:hypothetical protein